MYIIVMDKIILVLYILQGQDIYIIARPNPRPDRDHIRCSLGFVVGRRDEQNQYDLENFARSRPEC